MRIFPIALIVIGSLYIAKDLGLVPVAVFHLMGPLLLIALGVALLWRRPRRCGGDWRARNGRGGTHAAQPPSSGLV
jgi:uncharacterized membrane protein